MQDIYLKATSRLSVGKDSWEKVWTSFRYDILAFCAFLNYVPSSEQRIFLLHVQYVTLYNTADSKRVMAKSGQGCGKTLALCVAVLWRHLRSPGTISVISAPTADQCKIVFFAEFQRLVAGAPSIIAAMLKIDASQAYVKHGKYGKAWRIVSRTASNPDCLRGLHHPDMTVALEEMSGIEMGIMEVFLGTCSQENNLLMGIGNPAAREGYFFKAFADPATMQNWPRRMTLSREKLSQERPDICSPNAIRALEREWGRDSDMFKVAVLGEFPSISGDTVLPYDWIRRASKTPTLDALEPTELKVVSMDFARFGGDENVGYARQGNAIVDQRIVLGMEPTQLARWGMHKVDTLGWDKDTVFVPDSTGMGQGVLGILYEGKRKVFEFHNHGKPRKAGRKYDNMITRAWFEFRDLLYSGVPVSIPDDDALVNQLASMRYEFTEKNKIKVFSKDKYKEKTGLSSPDRAEACVMAYCEAHQAKSQSFEA